jgi:hypothetical protein
MKIEGALLGSRPAGGGRGISVHNREDKCKQSIFYVCMNMSMKPAFCVIHIY